MKLTKIPENKRYLIIPCRGKYHINSYWLIILDTNTSRLVSLDINRIPKKKLSTKIISSVFLQSGSELIPISSKTPITYIIKKLEKIYDIICSDQYYVV